MSPERETRIVGRCTECHQPILEVVDVVIGPGMRVHSRVLRRCGCGDWREVADDD